MTTSEIQFQISDQQPSPSFPQSTAGSAGTDAHHPKRAKRGRYTAVACKECKKKKLKCLPASGGHCARCIANDLPCVYLRGPSRSSRTGWHGGSGLEDHEQNTQITTLSNELTVLRRDMSTLLQTVNELQSKVIQTSTTTSTVTRTTTPPPSSSSVASSSQSLLHAPLPLSTSYRQQRRRPSSSAAAATAQQVPLVQSPNTQSASEGAASGGGGGGRPRPAQYIGPTRPAYAFHVGEGALTRMGIPIYESLPPSRSLPPTRPVSPATGNAHDPPPTPAQYWTRTEDAEIDRLVQLWRDEVYAIYPFLDLDDEPRLRQTLTLLRSLANGSALEAEDDETGHLPETTTDEVTTFDTDLIQIVVSTGMVLDFGGRTELATSIVESVRSRFFLETYAQTVCLKRVQLLVLLSIYYFHADEELSSWRMIGLAARDAIELGLHRRQSMFETYKDDKTRQLATRVFWCLYVLDRRWSFGTGLSFAVVDRDIDPDLPEPGPEHAYLKSMVGYGRLCSRIWAAIPPSFATTTTSSSSSSPQDSTIIPEHVVDQLDREMQEWHHSIPFHLQLRHPRLGMAPPSQPPELQRLRTMLYLRGNHLRCLMYRHYLLNPATVYQNLDRAWLVVHIAEDSIEVLTHLRATTQIYARQPHAFHYFLMSALAVVFLAVCHAPEIFTRPCRRRFMEAVELIKSFSQQSAAGRQLWKTIRTLLVRLKSLGLQQGNGEDVAASSSGEQSSEREASTCAAAGVMFGWRSQESEQLQQQQPMYDQNAEVATGREGLLLGPSDGDDDIAVQDSTMDDMLGSVPNQSPDGIDPQDLMSVFDALGQGYLYPQQQDETAHHFGTYPTGFDFVTDMGGDILRQFQGFV